MIKMLVHNRLRIQRGQALIGMIYTTMIMVGVYRDSLPHVSLWVLGIVLGGGYLGLSWLVGLIDEKTRMFRYEQERMTQMNPQVNEILDRVRRIEEKLSD